MKRSLKELWLGALLAAAVLVSLALLTWTGFTISTILMLVLSDALFLSWLKLRREKSLLGGFRQRSTDVRAVLFTAATAKRRPFTGGAYANGP